MERIEKLLGIKDRTYARHVFIALCISFVVALGAVLYRNPGSWMDEQSHYYRAIQISNGDVYKNDNGNMALFGGMVSETQQSFMDYFIKNGPNHTFGLYPLSKVGKFQYSEKNRFQAATNAVPYHPLVYFPYVLIVLLNKILHLTPATEFIFMRLSGLAFAFFILILSIRIMPFSKWTIAALSLHPTILLTNSAISADVFTNVSIIFFVACLTKVTYKVAKLKSFQKLDAIQLGISIILISLAKVPAFLIIISVFPMLYFANKEKLTSRLINIFLLFTLFFSILCSLLLIVLIKDVNTGAYFGRNVNTFKQLSHIFSNIFNFISMYLREIFSYDYTVIQLGYAEEVIYQKPPILVSILYYVAYGLSCLYQEKEYRVTKIDIKKFNLIQIGKILSFFAIILSTFLILYLQFSIVGSDIIEGVQQRYFIAYSLLLLTFIPNIAKLKRPFLNGIVVVTYCPLITYIIYFFTQIF